jgi:hypothetical protein
MLLHTQAKVFSLMCKLPSFCKFLRDADFKTNALVLASNSKCRDKLTCMFFTIAGKFWTRHPESRMQALNMYFFTPKLVKTALGNLDNQLKASFC